MRTAVTRTALMALGASSVVALLAPSARGAVLPHAVTPVPSGGLTLADDDGSCELDDVAENVRRAPEVRHARHVLTVARRQAARLATAERRARRAMAAAAGGTAGQQAAAAAAYAVAHSEAARARATVVRATRALAAARRHARARLLAAACPSLVVPPTPTPPVLPPTTGPVPTGLVADATTTTAAGALRLSWAPMVGATSYRVYRGGTLLGSTTATRYVPGGTVSGVRASYSVAAVVGGALSPRSTAISAGPFAGDLTLDAIGRTVYGQVRVTVVATGRQVTGCWATYPATGTSGAINAVAVPTLCREAITAQSAAITSVSGASAISAAFTRSLQGALTRAGI